MCLSGYVKDVFGGSVGLGKEEERSLRRNKGERVTWEINI